MDPQVSIDKVPSYEIVEEKIKQIDGGTIILRIFFVPVHFIYRFQLIKNNRGCMVEIPKKLLDDLKSGSPESEEELTKILKPYFKSSDSWTEM